MIKQLYNENESRNVIFNYICNGLSHHRVIKAAKKKVISCYFTEVILLQYHILQTIKI